MRLWRSAVLALSLLVVAACSPAAPVVAPAPSPPSPSEREVAVGCRSLARGGLPVHFDSVDGARLGGLMLGSGPVGIVLVHQVNATLCQWLPYGTRLAERGYRVLLVDLGGYGSSEPSSKPDQDVKQAVGFLRQQGASSVVLMGGSLGGTAALSAAVIVEPPVTAVVSLSGPIRTHGMDLTVRIGGLAAPVLYVAATYDEPFSADAQTLYDGTVGKRKRILLVEGGTHGVALANEGAVSAAIDDFLDDFAPASR